MEQEQEKKIKGEIGKSGFPLEIESESILRRAGWSVETNIFYFNENAKDRIGEVDVVAEKSKRTEKAYATLYEAEGNYPHSYDIKLIIECKKSEDKPWVFFKQDKIRISRKHVKIAYPLTMTEGELKSLDNALNSHHYSNTPVCRKGFVAMASSNKENEKKQQISAAVAQVLGALTFYFKKCKDEIRRRRGEGIIVFFYPIVVFDGKLFSAEIDNAGEIKVKEEKEHILLLKQKEIYTPEDAATYGNVSFERYPYMIDIVKKEYLEKFLQNLYGEV